MPMPDEFEEHELGHSGTLEEAFGKVLDEVFEHTPFPTRGSWAMATEVNVDLEARKITMQIELTLREAPASASIESAGAELN
jgi:hypothetical protein